MDEKVRNKLAELIQRYRSSVEEEPQRIISALRDYCATSKEEIRLLDIAVKAGILDDLLSSSVTAFGIGPTVKRCVQKIVAFGVSEGKAIWAAEAWALALDKISEKDLSPFISEKEAMFREAVEAALADKSLTSDEKSHLLAKARKYGISDTEAGLIISGMLSQEGSKELSTRHTEKSSALSFEDTSILNEFFVSSQSDPDSFLNKLSEMASRGLAIESDATCRFFRAEALRHKASIHATKKPGFDNDMLNILELSLKDYKIADELNPNLGIFKNDIEKVIDNVCMAIEAFRPGRAQEILGKTKLKYFMSGDKNRISIGRMVSEVHIPSEEQVIEFANMFISIPIIVRSALVASRIKNEYGGWQLQVLLISEDSILNDTGKMNDSVGILVINDNGTYSFNGMQEPEIISAAVPAKSPTISFPYSSPTPDADISSKAVPVRNTGKKIIVFALIVLAIGFLAYSLFLSQSSFSRKIDSALRRGNYLSPLGDNVEEIYRSQLAKSPNSQQLKDAAIKIYAVFTKEGEAAFQRLYSDSDDNGWDGIVQMYGFLSEIMPEDKEIKARADFSKAHNILKNRNVNDYSKALKLYHSALTLKPNWVFPINGIAKIYISKTSNYYSKDEALIWYNRACEVDPNFPWAYSNVAAIRSEELQWEMAEQALLKAVKIKSDRPSFYIDLGKICEKQQKQIEAINYYNEALKYEKNSEMIIWLEKRITSLK